METSNKGVNPKEGGCLFPCHERNIQGHVQRPFITQETEPVSKNMLFPPPMVYMLYIIHIIHSQHSQPNFPRLLCLKALAAPGHTSWNTLFPHVPRWFKFPMNPLFAMLMQSFSPRPPHITEPLTHHPSPKPPSPYLPGSHTLMYFRSEARPILSRPQLLLSSDSLVYFPSP